MIAATMTPATSRRYPASLNISAVFGSSLYLDSSAKVAGAAKSEIPAM
jgi:hypothetical protein